MNLSFKKQTAVLLIGLALSGYAVAEGKDKLPAGAAATVNGTVISSKTLDKIVKANLPQGQKETPEFRKVILDELIAREIFSQASAKQGLDKTPEAQAHLIPESQSETGSFDASEDRGVGVSLSNCHSNHNKFGRI